jgi:hypothetical protein
VAREDLDPEQTGPEGLELIVFGPHHGADGEPGEDAWVE